MDLLEQPEIKKTYEKCKYIVKVWEHKFTKKFKRLPSKLDIREASNEVRHAYRKYFQLKTAALEHSFMDVDGFEEDETIETDGKQEILNKLGNNTLARTENVEVNNCDSIISEEIWGKHLNNNKEETKPDSRKGTDVDLKLNITKKLFCGSKFSKRNPRKSFSFTQKNKSDTFNDSSISLSQPTLSTTSFATFKSEDAIFSSGDNIHENNSIKFITPADKVISQPVNIIQSVLQDNFRPPKDVDSGWLERVANETGASMDNADLSLPTSSVFSNSCNNINIKITPQLHSSEVGNIVYDSDDIIDDSDDDIPCKDLNSFHIRKKTKIENKNIFMKTSEKSSRHISSHENFSTIIKQTIFQEKVENHTVTIDKEITTNKEISLNSEPMDINVVDDISCKDENKTFIRKEPTTSEKLSCKKKDYVHSKTSNIEQQKRKQKKKSSVTIKQQKSEKTREKIAPRRSTRQTRIKVNLQEFSSGEEDPFYSETENDPEFSITSQENTKEHEDSDSSIGTETVLRKQVKTKLNQNKRTSHIEATNDQTLKEENETNESKLYELEFSIKPRVVAPRYKSIKNVLDENTITTKGNKSSKIVNKSSNLLNQNKHEDNLSIIKDKMQQAKEKLEKKIATGKLNKNFVRINLKKKVFSRGKTGKSFSKYKKAQWKSKKAKALCGPDMDMGGCDGGMLTCFNCGQTGHFARNCKAMKGDGLLPLTQEQEESCPYPTLEEASQMAKESVLSIRKPNVMVEEMKDSEEKEIFENSIPEGIKNSEKSSQDKECLMENDFDDSDSELLLAETLKLEEYVKKLDVKEYMDMIKTVKPYFELQEDESVIDTPPIVFETLNKFGHESFRPGQEEAIMRILSGKSTLVTLSTGSGKSLCYQLPAYLYSKREPCISLIISPLVSLMDDQVTGIPKFMKAACLHSNQTQSQRQKILEAISLGELSVLLVSPEAVVAGERQVGFGSLLRKLPPIAFACIDEAHCVSQWSHNFRPSYLMICRVLRESLGVKTILGLTATATRATRESIINHLQIPDGLSGVISDIPLPDNLILTSSKDQMRDHALLSLLLSKRFSECKSIIIYCTRRDECERIASFLRTSLKSERVEEGHSKKRKRVNLQAEPYHAGLAASRRRTIQNKFMSGDLRIVVATVAFGMGINKSDIRAVIHYNMPNSFESYVQEVGRAGRDGLNAHCHVFLDSEGRDEHELQRHIHANSMDRHVIRKLLKKIFIPCSCTDMCPKHEVAFSIDSTVRELDVPEENISTLLCYLELHENKYIEVLSPAYTTCKVISYGGPLQIRKAAKECPPLAMALALHKKKTGEDPNVLEFPVIDVAAAMGWESGICKHKLKNLEWTTSNNQPVRSAISVQFSNLGFRLLAPGNLSDNMLDEALDNLYNRVVDQERKSLLQLHVVHKTLVDVCQSSYHSCLNEEGANLIKSKVREYFDSPDPFKFVSGIKSKEINEEQLVKDIHSVICMYRDNTFTGRSIARIFHGIQSPNYPAVIWGRSKFWRRYLDTDFHSIVKIATREIIKMR